MGTQANTDCFALVNLTDADHGYGLRVRHNGVVRMVRFRRTNLGTRSVLIPDPSHSPALVVFARQELAAFLASGL